MPKVVSPLYVVATTNISGTISNSTLVPLDGQLLASNAGIISGSGRYINDFSLNSNVQAMSAGLNTRISTLEVDMSKVASTSASWALNSNVQAMSAGLNTRITNQQTTLAALTTASGSFALNSNVQAMSAGLNTRITANEITDAAQQVTLSAIAAVSGSYVHLVGNETISGTKQFNNAIIVPAINVSGSITNVPLIPTNGQILVSVNGVISGSGATLSSLSASISGRYLMGFNNATLSSGVLSIAHNLQEQYVSVTIYDNNFNQVIPDSINVSNVNTAYVDLSSYGALTGNWTALVLSKGGSGNAVFTLGQISDVTLTSPLSGQKLTYNGTKWVNSTSKTVKLYQAYDLDSPNNSDWTVSTFAPMIADLSASALTVRKFDDTTEQGVGCAFSMPENAAKLEINIKSKAQTPPTSGSYVTPRMYFRKMPTNTGVLSSWSSANDMSTITISSGTTAWNKSNNIFTLSSLGINAGDYVQFELTRKTAGVGGNLAGNWLVLEYEVVVY